MVDVKFNCSNCGNTTFEIKVDEDKDVVIECLACGERELMPTDNVE